MNVFDVVAGALVLAGSVLARKLAEDSGQRVLVVDKRDHIAGNAYDHRDAAGILHQRLAERAERVVFTVAGIPMVV